MRIGEALSQVSQPTPRNSGKEPIQKKSHYLTASLLGSIFYLHHLISQKVRFGKGDRCEIGLSRTCLYLGKVWCKMQHRCLYQAHRQVVGNS